MTDMNDYDKAMIQKLFMNQIQTGADAKTLQYDMFAKNISTDIIDLKSLISEHLFNYEAKGEYLVINIEKDIQRYKSIVEELGKLSLTNFVHIKATYWKEKEKHIEDLNFVLKFLRQFNDQIEDKKYEFNEFSEVNDKNVYIQDGPLACYCSHVRAMIYSYLHNNDYTIIFEDDVFIADTSNIEKYIKTIPNDWDVITMNSVALNTFYTDKCYKFKDIFHSTHFYIIKNKSLPFIFKNIYPIVDQIDVLIAKLHNQLNIYNIVDTVYQKNYSTNTQNNLYVIFNSPNYDKLRKDFKKLRDLLHDYLNYLFPNNDENNYRITLKLLFDVIYTNIINSHVVTDNTTYPINTHGYPHHEQIYNLIFGAICFSAKGINIHNRTTKVLHDIDNILTAFNLHDGIDTFAYNYGSSANVYLHSDGTITKHYNNNLRWTTINHDNIQQIYQNERELLNNDHNKVMISYDDEKLIIRMHYSGESLFDKFNLPNDWKDQIIAIFEHFDKLNISYPEFNLKNILVKDDVITFIDYGLASNNDDNTDQINKNNRNVFIELLDILNDKFRDIEDNEQKQILYFTFINNMKLTNQYIHNIF